MKQHLPAPGAGRQLTAMRTTTMMTKRDLERLKRVDLGTYTLAEACVLRSNLLATIRQCRDRSLRPAARAQLRRVGLSIRHRTRHRNAQTTPEQRRENYMEALEKLGFCAQERQKLSQ